MATKKNNPRRKPRTNRPVLDLQFPDMTSLDIGDELVSDGDDDLELELQELLSDGGQVERRRKQRPKKPVLDIEQIANQCMKDVTSEEDDENISDEDSLMAELTELTKNDSGNEPPPPLPAKSDLNSDYAKMSNAEKESSSECVTLLKERLTMYKEAKNAVLQIGDQSKARRYARAIQVLESLLKSVMKGIPIKEEDIPPVVVIQKSPSRVIDNTGSSAVPLISEPMSEPLVPHVTPLMLPGGNSSPPIPQHIPQQTVPPRRPAPTIPKPSETEVEQVSDPVQVELNLRQNQYKKAALKAKQAGDMDAAKRYIFHAKEFGAVIDAAKQGKAIDISKMPPRLVPAEQPVVPKQSMQPDALVVPKPASPQPENKENTAASEMEAAALAAANEPEDAGMFNAPPPPLNILEGLHQRLEKFCSTRDAAKAEGNNGKARRLNRIVQQYEEAIKMHKKGKTVAFEDLPIPPGFSPLPVDSTSAALPTDNQKPDTAVVVPLGKSTQKPVPVQKETQQLQKEKVPSQSPDAPKASGRNPRLQRANTSTILEKQLKFLIDRQNLFKQAALESKRNGDIQQAKEYLRMCKGFEPMIEATKNGLPIDATTIPTPPQLEADYVIVDKSDVFNPEGTAENETNLFGTLEKELQHQIELCARNKEHFLCLGDVSSASKFEKLGLETKKDLAYIQHLHLSQNELPVFHYETRLFSLVQCNTELADNVLEVSVERGINLPGKPDELDSFVRIEFPIPAEAPQRAKTHTVKDTNNPIYKESFKFEINRKSRSNVRLFKRGTMKLEVWSKGGFFKSDTLLGTTYVKLVDLENKCSIHNSFDLMEGRKVCGGKLEVKIKLRDPLLVKQVEEVREKWLVITVG